MYIYIYTYIHTHIYIYIYIYIYNIHTSLTSETPRPWRGGAPRPSTLAER